MSFLTNETDSLLHNDSVISASSSDDRYEEQRDGGSSILGTIMLIINATLGAGLLNFPQAFDRAGGIAVSLIIQLCFLVFIIAALIILAKCSDLTNSCSMQDAFAQLCGQKYLFFCGLCVICYSFGCCLTFLIIIGDQFDRVLATYYGMDFCNHWYLSRAFITSISSIIFILPLCFFKSLDVLSYASMVGCLNIFYVVWVIVYESSLSVQKPIRIWPENSIEPLQIIPIICFAYQSHMSAIPTYICMKNRSLGWFSVCAVVSMVTCFLAYTLAGFYGYTTFGSGKVPSDILQGYTERNIFLSAAMVAVAIKIFTTYPIVLYCGRDALLGLVGIQINHHWRLKVGVTLIWFFLSLIAAILVPDISPIINLMGSLSAAFIFIFPGICFLQSVLQKDEKLLFNKSQFFVVFAIFMIILGVFTCGLVFTEAIQDLRKPYHEHRTVTGLKIGLTRSLCA